MWNATVLSLFPEMFPGTLDFSIAGKALRKNLWSLKTVNIRQFSKDKNGKVDQVPFGGGPGMVINPEVLDKALKSVSKTVGRRIYLSPRGKKFDQEFANKLSHEKGAVNGKYIFTEKIAKNSSVEDVYQILLKQLTDAGIEVKKGKVDIDEK